MNAKRICLILFVLVLSYCSVQSQSADSLRPQRTQSVSIYASFVIAGIMNLSYENLKLNEKGRYVGFTTGYNKIWLYDKIHGFHLAYTSIFGQQNHHFETKLGLSFNPIAQDESSMFRDYYSNIPGDFTVMPVITLGYRYQKPGGKMYWRIAASTAGLGTGIGIVLKSK